jgi:hypothetical protein
MNDAGGVCSGNGFGGLYRNFRVSAIDNDLFAIRL